FCQTPSATFSSAGLKKKLNATGRLCEPGYVVPVGFFCSIALAEYGPFANSTGFRYTAALYAIQSAGASTASTMNVLKPGSNIALLRRDFTMIGTAATQIAAVRNHPS